MSRLPFFYDCIDEMSVIEGLCLSHRSTLGDAVSCVKSKSHLTHVALKNDSNAVIGVMSVGELYAGFDRLGADAELSSVHYDVAAVISVNESVAVARDLMSREKLPILAVIRGGEFVGMLPAYKILNQISGESSEAADKRANVSNIVSQYVNYVAHDLRNPLCVIVAVGNLLDRLIHENEQLRQFSDLINRASQQALYLSDGLVQLERYAVAGRVFPKRINLAEFVDSICTENRELVQYRGRTLIIEKSEAMDVQIDPYIVRRILLNLIDNACKHSPVGSKVFIAAQIGSNDGDKFVELSVRDEGVGMTAKESEAIFEPFFQLKTDQQALGYGLGLTIARRFSELHCGTIRAEVLKGVGSKFILRIPCVEH